MLQNNNTKSNLVKRHPFNHDLSKKVYKQLERILEPKGCYLNVFNVLTYNPAMFRLGEWKIAYGYIRVLENHNMMARHCFIVNKKGEAIDPTIFTIGSKGKIIDEYYSFFIYDNVELYIDDIERNQNIPDLISPLMKVETKTSMLWAEENDYVLIR